MILGAATPHLGTTPLKRADLPSCWMRSRAILKPPCTDPISCRCTRILITSNGAETKMQRTEATELDARCCNGVAWRYSLIPITRSLVKAAPPKRVKAPKPLRAAVQPAARYRCAAVDVQLMDLPPKERRLPVWLLTFSESSGRNIISEHPMIQPATACSTGCANFGVKTFSKLVRYRIENQVAR